jgi:hypothetical protein
MKSKTHNILFAALVLLTTSVAAIAQLAVSKEATSVDTISLTFSFPETPVGLVSYQRQVEGRFYLEFPSANRPTVSFSQLQSAVDIRRENQGSSDQLTIYSIAFEPGSSPRFGSGNALNSFVLTFSPPQKISSNVSGSTNNTVKSIAVSSVTSSQPLQLATPSVNVPQPSASPSAFDEAVEKVNLANVDLSVPQSPAFTVLGITPETVVRPTSPRQFASSLLNGIDQRGNFQSGVALDFAPYLLHAGDHLTLHDYRKSYGLRLLARSQVSFATTKGASEDDKAIRLATGVHLTLFDFGDPHSDSELMQCFKDNLKLPGPPTIAPPEEPEAGAPDIEKLKYELELKKFNDAMAEYERARKAIVPDNIAASEKCRELSRKRNWNRSSWIVAAAPAWISETGATKDLRYDGAGVWSSIAYGFEGVPGLEHTSQLIFHLRYRDNESVPDPDSKGTFFRQDGLFAGARLRVGTENTTAAFEGVFQRLRRHGQPFDNSARFALGLEKKVSENMWFQVAFGSQTSTPEGKSKGFVLTSFKWGFTQKRTFDTPGLTK